jgi:hypothetical protein
MTKKSLYKLFMVLSLAGYVWLGWNVIETASHPFVPSLCLFKDLTGIPCPSCGTTRSLVALIHGNLKEALEINPLGLIIAIALVVVPLWIITDMLKKSDSLYRLYNKMENVFSSNKWVSVTAVLILVINWVWNIIKGL